MKSSLLCVVIALVVFPANGFVNFIHFPNVNTSAVELLIPTLKSQNAKCRNHSEIYLKELKRFSVWATDMFDATTKFPTGIFAGSNYDLGNFDECVKVHLPDEYGFSGKYCMAKVKMTPKMPYEKSDKRIQYVEEYSNIYNISTWEKVGLFSKYRHTTSRDETHFSFCIPSTCNDDDLEFGLKESMEELKKVMPYDMNFHVHKRNCQVETGFNFDSADITFISVVVLFFLMSFCCTWYHLGTKLDGLVRYKLKGNTHKVLTSFSMAHNIRKMTSQSSSPEAGLECMHGVKALSMFLIIMGHRLMFILGSPIVNPSFVEGFYRKPDATFLLNGPIIVDTFFTISGFLASYIMIMEYEKRNGKLSYLTIIIHRLVRMTPAYAVVLSFYCTIFVKIGSGPFWQERVGVEQERCLTSWWANLIYVNNYINVNSMCMFQSWYLTCDMHYYMITPILAYLLWKRPKAGLIATCALIFGSIIVLFTVIIVNNENGILLLYMKFLKDPTTHHTFQNIYIPSHLRASPYFVGVLLGFFKFKIRQTGYKPSKTFQYLGWIFGSFVIAATLFSAFIFYIPTVERNQLFTAFYGSMHHFTWSICIGGCIIAVSEGYGKWISPYLCWPPLAVLSRITYTAFLCHGAIQLLTVSTLRTPYYVSAFGVVYQSSADIVLAYAAGFLLSIFFESPIMGLEKIIFAKDISKNKVKPVTDIFVPKISIVSDKF